MDELFERLQGIQINRVFSVKEKPMIDLKFNYDFRSIASTLKISLAQSKMATGRVKSLHIHGVKRLQ